MARTTHLRSDLDALLTLCGMLVEAPGWTDGKLPVSDTLLDAAKPCRICLRIDAKREPPFVRGAATSAVFGAREAVVIDRPRVSDDEAGRRWLSTQRAYHAALRYRGEREAGASLPSSSDWESAANRVQETRDPSRGGRDHARIEEYGTILATIQRAALDPDVIAVANSFGVDVENARLAFERDMGGRWKWVPVRKGGKDSKGRVKEWSPVSRETVAAELADRCGVKLSVDQVDTITRAFLFFGQDALLAAGIVGERRQERPPEEASAKHERTDARVFLTDEARAVRPFSGMAMWAANLRGRSAE